ncbi:MAG TPA: tRNA glutamyl-Q(34) synthetase GluQRS [Chthoniobacteraceae bacterium]|jgi:glutamyl-tRNA synthetase|nr:tRNA glutamyl-Q(34) synthetase GluQRS [Chthoniobacteraceae bacterium]
MRALATPMRSPSPYRGRLAPSPTGYLHLGHARTFCIAQERAGAGTLILRDEDLDRARCRALFAEAMLEDLRWLGLRWSEGPDVGGPFAPYTQSARRPRYVEAFERLRAGGFLYPCYCSRQRIAQAAASAPHLGEEEPVYPGTCRPPSGAPPSEAPRAGINWRFRLPEREMVAFVDGNAGEQRAVCGADFGDFVAWRKDDFPAYQLAVVVDDAAMEITEVVRGADLITSTFRQLLLYRALGLAPPLFFHCALMLDAKGARLAKRHDSLSLRALRARGVTPEEVRAMMETAARS